MLQFLRFWFASVFLLLTFTQSPAQTGTAGGRGILRVYSAETIQARSLIINSFFLSHLQKNGSSQNFNLALTYGLSDNFELAAQLVPYQNAAGQTAGPGGAAFALKWHLPLTHPTFQAGLRMLLVLPAGKAEAGPPPFSSSQIAWGITGLLNLEIPALPLKVFSNFGYFDQNIESLFTSKNSDQLLLGFGAKYPAAPFIFYTELSGEFFFQEPQVSFWENPMRLTQGLKLRPLAGVTFDFGFDIGVSRKAQAAVLPRRRSPRWGVFAGLTYHFVPRARYGLASDSPRIDSRRQQETLDEIRQKRTQVDDYLDEMREKLQDEASKR